MIKPVVSRKSQIVSGMLSLLFMSSFACAEEINRPDLPPQAQVERALNEHLLVLNAVSNLKTEQANQTKWNNGVYEFNLRAGSSQRNIASTGQKLKEWDVALERALRLPNKVGLDQDIGAAGLLRAQYALGDAHHEAGRMLLKLWFGWQKEQTTADQWQRQAEILAQQAEMTEKRVKAGDAPRLEANLARAAAAQANVTWHQALLRAQLAANDLSLAYPAIALPEKPVIIAPTAIDHDLEYWKSQIFADNHELGMVQAQNQVQQLLAMRSRADRIPDPTIGMRYSNEMGGNEKLAGLYLTVPLSYGHRSTTAQIAEQAAVISSDQEAYVKRRLDNDIRTAHLQAVRSFDTWRMAEQVAASMQSNAELIARAYQLGETSLSDSLSARRLAHESRLAENLSRLDANEAHYRLLLDAHQLWALDEKDEHAQP